MNVYRLLKLNRYIRSTRIKCIGLYCLHLFKKRYLGIFLDPVLACNIRCKMCYFSDPEKRKTLKGKFSQEELNHIATALFHRTLKLQIGCGAEPTIYPHNVQLIQLGKKHGIPHISMTTNANLLSENNWWELIEAGLNEVTLSVHGVTKESYEYFMEGASYEKFHNAMTALTEIKNKYPEFIIRINYTVNKDNLDELNDFFNTFKEYKFDVLQIRPIQQIGESTYNDFSWEEIINKYDDIIQKLKSDCIQREITCLAPEKRDLTEGATEDNNPIIESTYCYASPDSVWKEDFNWRVDTYESYSKRTKLGRKLFGNIFRNYKKSSKQKKSLNYSIN